MTAGSWAPGFLQGSDCRGPSVPTASAGALANLPTESVGSGDSVSSLLPDSTLK